MRTFRLISTLSLVFTIFSQPVQAQSDPLSQLQPEVDVQQALADESRGVPLTLFDNRVQTLVYEAQSFCAPRCDVHEFDWYLLHDTHGSVGILFNASKGQRTFVPDSNVVIWEKGIGRIPSERNINLGEQTFFAWPLENSTASQDMPDGFCPLTNDDGATFVGGLSTYWQGAPKGLVYTGPLSHMTSGNTNVFLLDSQNRTYAQVPENTDFYGRRLSLTCS